jgi:hypothetical protein
MVAPPNRGPNTTCHKQALLWPKAGESAGASAGVLIGLPKAIAANSDAVAQIIAISRQ